MVLCVHRGAVKIVAVMEAKQTSSRGARGLRRKGIGFCALGALALLLSGGCQRTVFEPVEREGTTLPVPDMSKVSFSSALTGQLLLTGGDEAVTPEALLQVQNLRTTTVDETMASATGSFVLHLSDAVVGDQVQLSLTLGEERSDEVPLELVQEGVPPPAPQEVEVLIEGEIPHLVVQGMFEGAAPVNVRIVDERSGIVVDAETLLVEGVHRRFEIVFPVDLNTDPPEALLVYGVAVEDPTLTSSFVAVQVPL